MKMKILLFIIITGLIFFFLCLKLTTQSGKRCYTHQVSQITLKDGVVIEFNVDIDLVYGDSEQNEVYLFGSIKYYNENYNISRIIQLTKKKSPFKNTSNVVITKEIIHPRDDVPTDLWDKYALPLTRDLSIYITRTNLKDNAMLISTLDNPIFVCALQN